MTLAIVFTLLGLALLVTGVALIFVPAAFIVAGAGVGAIGLFAIDDGQKGAGS